MKIEFDKLSTLCDIQIGKTPSRKISKYWGKGTPWVAISDLKKRYICKTKEQITQIAVDETNCKLIPKDTLLMSFKLSIGKLAFSECDLYTNEAIAALSIKNKKELHNNYLYYALKNIPLLKGAKIAVKGNTLNKKSLGKLNIPLPESLDDQIKIANLLTQVELLIAKREESIVLLDELLKSTFLDMFGDPIANPHNRDEVRLDEIVVLQRGFDLPKSQRNINGDIALYGSNGIVDFHDESKLDEGIITGRSGTIGKVYYSHEPFWPLNTTLFSKNIKGNNIIYLTFLLRFFRLERFRQGAGVPTLNKNIIHKEKIYKVDRKEQEKFATIVQQVETTKEKYQDSLDELNELFGSLSQRAFRGELDLSGMVSVHIPVIKALDDPSSSGARDIDIERQEVKYIEGDAKSGAGELEEILDVPIFIRKQIADAREIAKSIDTEQVKVIANEVKELQKSFNMGDTIKQMNEAVKLFKDIKIPSIKIDIPPLYAKVPSVNMESINIFKTSQQIMESLKKREEHIYKMLDNIPQIKEAIERDILCKDDFLEVALRYDYEYAEIKRIIMDKLASNKLAQHFDGESKSIKLVKAT